MESLCFVTPEQKLLRYIVSQPSTSFTPRVLSSKLKGVRGLGGVDGITQILRQFEDLGLLHFLNNRRAVQANDDSRAVRILKMLNSVCELEGLQSLIQPHSNRGILFGSRANGRCDSHSDYDLFVVTDEGGEVEKIVSQHPLRKKIELVVWNADDYLQIDKKDPGLANKLEQGIVMWGSTW